MAVQAQYPSNILLLNRNLQDGKNIFGNNDSGRGDGCGGFIDQSQLVFNNNGVGINPRKRAREVATTTTVANMNSFGFSLQNHQQFQQQQNQNQIIDLSLLHNRNQPKVVSTGLRLSFGDQNQQQQQQFLQQQQIQQQQQQQEQPSSSVLSLMYEDFALQLKQQSNQLNHFLHTQGEQLGRTLAEKRQRHYRALLGAAEETISRQLGEKEAQVAKAAKRNAELEAQAAQLHAEAQSWQARAQAHEAQAASLQAQIHQAIILNNNGGAQQQDMREGTGLTCAEDSESACGGGVGDGRVDSLASCRVCKSRAACVVMLPCRHLCVCKACDDVVSGCPVCHCYRSASVEVLFS